MRNIKFRAWDKEHNFMFSGTTIKEMIKGKTDLNENIKLMQFTGLYDDIGKEIYEGDIVKIQDKTETETKTSYISEVVITYNGVIVRPHPAHVRLGHWRELSWYCDYGVGDENRMADISCEIIGNIFKNPELLDGLI